MIFFDWKGLPEKGLDWSSLNNENPAGFAIKTAISVILFLLYTWTLIAPRILKNRNFEEN
jgi:hypothetical protein